VKLVRCDRHPDRDAVATFRVIELQVGLRPFLIGYSAGGRTIDLCDECAELVRPLAKPGPLAEAKP
jgi:hypothetical protein